MIAFQCDSCGRKLQVKDDFAGRPGKCPSCGHTQTIPTGEEAAERRRYEARERESDTYGLQAENEEREERKEPAEDEREREEERPAPRKRRPQVADSSGWEPLEGVTNHAGGDLRSRDEFFAEPPAEIGDVLSACSTLRQGVEPMSPTTRLVLGMVAGAVGLAIGVIIAVNIKNGFWQFFWPIVLAGVGLCIVLFSTVFSHTCTYVGKLGVARFNMTGNRDNVVSEVFPFADASELRTSQTRHYTNGVYQSTNYDYTWTDVTGRTRFSITGSHKSEAGQPAATDNFHFAVASEMAWTLLLLDQVQAQIKTGGTIYFGLGGKNWVRLGEEQMILHFNQETTECHVSEISHVRIEQGMVQVRRRDAKEGWFSSTGIYKFPYGSLANAQLFIFLLEKLVGVKIK